MDNNNNNNEMHNNKEIDKSGSPSPLSLAFSLVNYRWWISITRKSTWIKRITLVTLVPRWVIERRLWPETPPHFSCPLSSRWSGTCHGRPESRLLNIFFPASQPSDPRILPRKKKQGEGNYKSFDLSQIAETFSALANSFCWWSMAGRGSLLILWEDAGSSTIQSGPYYFHQQYFCSSSIYIIEIS